MDTRNTICDSAFYRRDTLGKSRSPISTYISIQWKKLMNAFSYDNKTIYHFNPFNVQLKSEGFVNRFKEIKSIFVGERLNKVNLQTGLFNYKFYEITQHVKFGVFNYLIEAPIHLVTHLSRAVTLGLLSFTAYTVAALKDLYERPRNGLFAQLILTPVLIVAMLFYGSLSMLAFAADALVHFVGTAIRQATNQLLIPFLGYVISPITLLVASIVHAGYGMAGLVSKRQKTIASEGYTSDEDYGASSSHNQMTGRVLTATAGEGRRASWCGQEQVEGGHTDDEGDDCSWSASGDEFTSTALMQTGGSSRKSDVDGSRYYSSSESEESSSDEEEVLDGSRDIRGQMN